MSDEAPWLVVGLGNPGKEYARNRHNVGFLVADLLASRVGAKFGRSKRAHAEVAEGRLANSLGGVGGGPKLVLVKPLTFMNLSGSAVASLG
ncbi:MAG: peptidyl-tRNA hydrolase, family, partial [Pseudonocardiales bacterium]|nr:peptidyl-tRNA hydrolase, family [Pseudonocardiales bacterium]